jgi:hypothetical protein
MEADQAAGGQAHAANVKFGAVKQARDHKVAPVLADWPAGRSVETDPTGRVDARPSSPASGEGNGQAARRTWLAMRF